MKSSLMRQLLPVLIVGAGMVAIAAFKWVDPYWPICWPCIMQSER
jgi:hypothetical protein